MSVGVKICGLSDAPCVKVAIESGAHYLGFVFHRPSARYIAPEDAYVLATPVPKHVKRVGLFVDASDDELQSVIGLVPLDMIQLHGNETPQRVADIRAKAGRPVMKVLHIATVADLKPVPEFEAVADHLLFDTRIGDEPTGGTGRSFDWTILRGHHFKKPWMLAGGLNVLNLAEAVKITGAREVDVSSGVENAEGHKDPAKIHAFISLAASLG